MDVRFWQGMVTAIALFVILPGIAYLAWLWLRQPKLKPVDWIAYNDAIRPLYTTRSAPLKKYLPSEPQGELRWYDDTGILAVRDWGFAQDVYLEDGTVKMIDTVSRPIYVRGG